MRRIVDVTQQSALQAAQTAPMMRAAPRWMSNVEVVVHTRAFSPEHDSDFVFSLFCELRAPELSAACASEEMLQQLLALQHRAQLASYRQAYPHAERALFVCDERAVGFWLVDRACDVFTLIDFALVASARGRGLGRSLLRGLQRQALERAVPIRLHVRPDNPALRLYQRLGFMTTARSQTELAMEWLA